MLLKIADLAPSESLDFSTQVDVKTLALSSTDDCFGETVALQGTVLYTGTVYRVGGKLNYVRTYVCDRCLKECQAAETAEFAEDFVRSAEADVVAAEDATVFDGDAIDLRELIRDTLVAGEPIRNLCRPECLGLCPVCGQNLNEGDCACDRRTVDPRLEGLLNLKFD